MRRKSSENWICFCQPVEQVSRVPTLLITLLFFQDLVSCELTSCDVLDLIDLSIPVTIKIFKSTSLVISESDEHRTKRTTRVSPRKEQESDMEAEPRR